MRKVLWSGTGGLVLSNWAERSMVVLVKIVFGQQIQIGQKLLENKFTGEWELIK